MWSSRPARLAGVSLFLVVTGCWVLGLASWERGWIYVSVFAFWAAVGISAVCVVLTGYLGRTKDALWLGWIPGATMIAVGFAMTPAPGGDEAGGTLIFFGGLVLVGWPFYFFPLIAVGGWLRRRRVAPTS
jgi:hypothetical protein